ncbi:hypothetical protein ACHAW6_008503 [Cyclotella cf. meneghiniana]
MIRHISAIGVAWAISLSSPVALSATLSDLNADNDIDQTTSHRGLSDLPDYGPEKGIHVLSRLLQMKSQARRLDETKQYDCGVIFFYDIPGTDGTALNEWLKQLTDANGADYISSAEDDSFVASVETKIQGNKGWTILHAQDDSLALHSEESLVQKWRDVVINQKCQFVAATILADYIDHSVSHTYKKLANCNCTSPDFKERGYDMDEAWIGQLDYFLFNNGKIEEMEVRAKVKRGLEILQRHFDLVVLNNHQQFANTLLRVTGWSSTGGLAKKMDGDLVFTKDLVSKFSKLAAKNGDEDFIDTVSHVYNDNLGYLMADLVMQ